MSGPLQTPQTRSSKQGVTGRKPPWLKVPLPTGEGFTKLKGLARGLKLHTVCEEARCPNVGECWSGEHPTMTIMVLGDECTRRCRFCAVKTVNQAAPPDPNEPEHVGRAIAEMSVGYVVITSVDRDDLADGGAGHYAACVREVQTRSPHTIVETLIPDYVGDPLATLMEAGPDVLAHNVEVVPRLQRKIRDPRCSFERSLDTLREAKALRPDAFTKSSIMVGLGETRDEVVDAMEQLRGAGVDFLTLGQYLRPTANHDSAPGSKRSSASGPRCTRIPPAGPKRPIRSCPHSSGNTSRRTIDPPRRSWWLAASSRISTSRNEIVGGKPSR